MLKPSTLITLVLILFLMVSPFSLAAPARAQSTASTPHVLLPLVTVPVSLVEWTLHKTADGLHPDASEQQMLWLMNRARANPAQEGLWLATTSIDEIAFPRDYFGVDINLLQSEFNSYPAKPPAAFDARMYAGSKAHSEDLIARDAQDHTGQFERIGAAGFSCWGGRASVFAYADSGVNAHAAFNIDWGGSDGSGMQDGRGHRQAIMSLDGDYTNVGIAMLPAPDGKSVGPLVTSAAYCHADQDAPEHFNRFIVGTVWQDRNGNNFYDPGEGQANVTVNASQGRYFAVTGAAGGYAIPVETPGDYLITFSGPVTGQVQVRVGETSMLADLQVPASASSLGLNAQMPLPAGAPHEPPPGVVFP